MAYKTQEALAPIKIDRFDLNLANLRTHSPQSPNGFILHPELLGVAIAFSIEGLWNGIKDENTSIVIYPRPELAALAARQDKLLGSELADLLIELQEDLLTPLTSDNMLVTPPLTGLYSGEWHVDVESLTLIEYWRGFPTECLQRIPSLETTDLKEAEGKTQLIFSDQGFIKKFTKEAIRNAFSIPPGALVALKAKCDLTSQAPSYTNLDNLGAFHRSCPLYKEEGGVLVPRKLPREGISTYIQVDKDKLTKSETIPAGIISKDRAIRKAILKELRQKVTFSMQKAPHLQA